jgi:Ca-activated chloride channel family protein
MRLPPLTVQFARRTSLCALLALALLLLASPNTYAQSGRNKKTAGKPTSSEATRPKRVGTNGDAPQTQPQPQPTPVMRLPSGTIVMDEAPPPAPAPRPTPTPAEDTAAGDDIGVEDVVRVTSNLVTVPASVVDSQGRAVVNLQLEDFELRVDGQPKPITELSRAEVPVTLALLFDNSQSLSAAREFEKQAAMKFFRRVIRPIDRAAIYSVSTDVALVQPLTNNVQALVRTIEHFGKPEGATRLHDAIIEAAAYLRPYPGRKVIIIVSDGEDTLSDHDFDEALRKVLAADCQVYTVQTKQIEYVMLTGQTTNANLQALAAERRMQDITAHTGGALYTPLQTSDLDASFAQLAADLAQQYILSYYPTDERPDGRFRTISVRVATRPNMRVRARRGYYPRRTNEKFSFNTQPAPVNATVADAVNSVSQESSFQAESAPVLASNITQPEKRSDFPARSNRMGPSEMSDAPDAGRSVRPSVTEQPVVKREEKKAERRVAVSEPTTAPPQPTPKPAPDSNNTSTANAKPPASTSTSSTSTPSPLTTKPAPSAAATEPSAVASRPLSGGVLNSKAISLPKPQYPPGARSVRAAGMVTVEVLLDEEGKVISARAVDGSPFLRQAAVIAARQARFSPTVLSGKPVKVAGVITYKFSLEQ